MTDSKDQKYQDRDPYNFGRSSTHSTWKRLKYAADRVFNRTANVTGDLAQRGIIEMEIATLRLRLKARYAELGELAFQMKVGEEQQNVLDSEEALSYFEEIKILHSQVSSQKQRLEKLKEKARRDEYAGA